MKFFQIRDSVKSSLSVKRTLVQRSLICHVALFLAENSADRPDNVVEKSLPGFSHEDDH